MHTTWTAWPASLSVPAGINGSDEYVEYAQKQYKKTFSDASFAESKAITVDGVEGRDDSFTYSASGMKMKTRVVYLLKGSQAYTLTSRTLDEEFDKTEDDVQSMIEAFKMP